MKSIKSRLAKLEEKQPKYPREFQGRMYSSLTDDEKKRYWAYVYPSSKRTVLEAEAIEFSYIRPGEKDFEIDFWQERLTAELDKEFEDFEVIDRMLNERNIY